MPPAVTGACQCKRVRFIASGAPRDVHLCHCSMCRRAVGNAFATLAWFDVAQLAWPGDSPELYRSSSIARRGFCGRCGTPLSLQYDGSHEIALMIGAFDDPQSYAPSHHYGIEGKLPWADIGAHLPGRPTRARSPT